MKSSYDFHRCHASSSAHDRSVTTGGPACRARALARGAGRESWGLAQDDLLLRGGQAHARGAAPGAAGRGPRVRSGRAHWRSARAGDAFDLRYAAGLTLERTAELLRASPAGRELCVSGPKISALENGRLVRGRHWKEPEATGRLSLPWPKRTESRYAWCWTPGCARGRTNRPRYLPASRSRGLPGRR